MFRTKGFHKVLMDCDDVHETERQMISKEEKQHVDDY